jgi:hypothetical protein
MVGDYENSLRVYPASLNFCSANPQALDGLFDCSFLRSNQIVIAMVVTKALLKGEP